MIFSFNQIDITLSILFVLTSNVGSIIKTCLPVWLKVAHKIMKPLYVLNSRIISQSMPIPSDFKINPNRSRIETVITVDLITWATAIFPFSDESVLTKIIFAWMFDIFKDTVSPLYNVKFGAHFFLPYIGIYVNSIKGNYLFITL